MSNPQRTKGTAFENRLVEFFNERGYSVYRPALAGKNDKGDIVGLPLTVEAKNRRTPSFAQALDEARREAVVGGTADFVVIANRNRSPLHRAYVVMELDQFERWMKDRYAL